MSTESTKPVSGRKVFWRSLEHKEDPSRLDAEACGSDVTQRTVDAGELTRMRRRSFLTLSSAISALAGIEGCIRRPVEKILPYTHPPEDVSPGVPAHYATVMKRGGEAIGVLVRSYEGRPTKIEGNPEHPASLGSTDLLTQASILDLYDADRARAPSRAGVAKTQNELDDALKAVAVELIAAGGQGVHVLAEPSNSPSFMRLRGEWKQRLPLARFHTWAPINDANERAATKLAFGQPLIVHNQFRNAKVIVALDSDFLLTETGNVVAARGFALGRTMQSAGDANMNRLYVVEPALTITGSNADHRLRMPAQSIGAYLKALAAELGANGISLGAVARTLGTTKLEGVPARWLKVVAKELASHRGESLVVVGSRQPPAVHALAYAINAGLQNSGRTVVYTTPVDAEESNPVEDIKALVAEMNAGRVKTLFILGGNPVHDAPADLKFKEALAKVPQSICLSSHLHETGALSTWQIPRAHELETWGDQISRDGHYAVQQPLIAPLFHGKSEIELLAAIGGDASATGHSIVQQTATLRGLGDYAVWRNLVQRGVATGSQAQVLGEPQLQDESVATAVARIEAGAQLGADNLELVFLPDNKLQDGRYANNQWLLELPDPITRITWDNVAMLAPSTAKQLGLANGDMVRISVGDASIEIPVWRQPGQTPNTVGLTLGWGRARAGSNASGAGFDVYPLRSSAALGFVSGAKLQKLGKRYPLSQTQEHDSMENRPVALDATLDAYRKQPDFAQWESPDPSTPPLWKRVDYSNGNQWGMVIDLNTCIGCSACAIACQAENNVSTVGKDQVSRGREMHWIRIDRYYIGEDADEPEVAFQPLACQHCEEAPCENVCPVNATSHSPEGLNDIAYNRCIGTRYCMNNCPYKVRRFNFFNFNEDVPDTKKMQFNPSVTVRFRGVIEKCSYCVQRIESSKIASMRENRPLRDGEIVSACQQACPTQAITFGNINDPASAVSKKRAIDRNYGLLAEIGTHPRTRFLGKIRNPNPEMKG